MNNKYKLNFYINTSNIHGNGIFANDNFKQKKLIGVLMHFVFFIPVITEELGRWVNHSYTPNCVMYYHKENNKYYIVALRDIKVNEELTIDYNDTPWFIRKPDLHFT